MNFNSMVVVTVDELDISTLHKANLKGVDFVEIRFDLLSKSFISNELTEILKETDKSYIFTYRKSKDSNQKIKKVHTPSLLLNFLSNFNSIQNYVDIELDNPKSILDTVHKSKFSKIYSYHNFAGSLTESQMLNLIQEIKSPNRKDIFKFAVQPKNTEELYRFLLGVQNLSMDYKIAGIPMGELGILGRLYSDKFCSSLTYLCLSEAKAPGQIKLDTYFKLRKILH